MEKAVLGNFKGTCRNCRHCSHEAIPTKKRKAWGEYPEFGGYDCATVVSIITDKDGSKYKILLDQLKTTWTQLLCSRDMS